MSPAPVDEHCAPDPDVHAAPAPDIAEILEPPVPQVQYIDKVVHVAVVQVPQVQDPQLQITETIVEIPEILTVQGTQTSESSGSAPVRHVEFA